MGWTIAKRAAFEKSEGVARIKRAGTIARMSVGTGEDSGEELSQEESPGPRPCAPSIVHMSL